MNYCTPRKEFRCILFTKENRDEFLKVVLPKDYTNYTIEEEEKCIHVHAEGKFTKLYVYGYWYVEEYQYRYRDPEFIVYSKDEFKKSYRMTDEFDMSMILEQLEDYGKYKGILRIEDEKCENWIPVSVAKSIVKGRGVGGVLGYLEK